MKVDAAFIYPVKSMRAVAVDSLTLDARGIVGDRRWMVVDEHNGFMTQRDTPELIRLQPSLLSGGLRLQDAAACFEVETPGLHSPRLRVTVWKDTLEALDAGDRVADWLSARLGSACRLVAFAPDVRRPVDETYARDAQTTFTDAYPLLVANEASRHALNATMAAPLPMDRFRPNLVVHAGAAWVEDGWKTLRVDGLVLEAVKPCARCVAITRDQRSGEQPQGSEPLSALARLHALPGKGAIFGMNLVHRGVGTLRVGSEVHVS